jgi:nitric oxide dioxygenase
VSPHHIEIVQGSYELVEDRAEEVAAAFYGRLFAMAPELQAMFPDDLELQGEKLMRTLGVIVRGLDDFGMLVHVAAALAGRHVDYGVREEHYELAGDALLWALAESLGAELTPEIERAWTEVYGRISSTMTRAAW